MTAYLDRWLVDGLAEHKATTRENYTTIVRKHITPTISSVRLDRLSPLDVQSVVNAKRVSHSASTVRLIFSVLHRALEQAVEWELMASNPAAKVKRPRAGEPHDRFLSQLGRHSCWPQLEVPGSTRSLPSAIGVVRRSRCAGRTSILTAGR